MVELETRIKPEETEHNNESLLNPCDRQESQSHKIVSCDHLSRGINFDNCASQEHRKKKQHKTPMAVYGLTILATIGGFLFGYDIGITAGAMLFIQPHFELSIIWQEAIVSGTIGAATVAALLSGYLTDRIGRKPTIMVSSVVFTVGGIVMAISPTKEVLLLGRIVSGLGVGLASVVVPIYVAEAAPVHIRGRLVSFFQTLINTGIVISSIIAGAFSYVEPDGWRYMLGLAAVPGTIQFIGFYFMPESPRWLINKGRFDQAKEVLVFMRGTDDIHKEFDEILMTVEEANQHKASGFFHLLKIFKTPHVRKALFVGSVLISFQAWTGINTVVYYSGTVLKMAGFPVKHAIWLVVVPNMILFLANFIGLYLVERMGRRKLAMISMAGCLVGLVMLAVGFQLAAVSPPGISPDVVELGPDGAVVKECHTTYRTCESCVQDNGCGFCYSNSTDGTCLPSDDEEFSSTGRCQQSTANKNTGMNWTFEYCPSAYTWIILIGQAIFMFAFSPGMAPLPWTINTEIYPLWARSTCNSMVAFVSWVMNVTIAFVFLTMVEAITMHGTFWFFTAIVACGVVFIFIFLPETKNITLEEVEQLFMTTEEKNALAASRNQFVNNGDAPVEVKI